ncbi:MAG TPA: ABC transporter permease, partial [Anaerolineaceae bacterium]|nr:ABC transporter permease [Anaerolineaceae bacterium]
MTKLFKVAKFEYARNVFTKRFWMALLLVPLLFILFSLISTFIAFKAVDTRPVGLIDKAGIITQAQKIKEKPGLFDIQIEFVAFTDEDSAKKVSLAGEHQGYIIIPEDYTTSYEIIWKGNKAITEEVLDFAKQYLSENLIANEIIPNQARIEEGMNLRLESLDGSIKSAGASWQRIIPPIVISMLYFALVMGSGNYLLQSLVEEKENRTIEIMLTTVSHKQLMAGKIIGNIGVGVTQLLVWAVIIAVALFIFRARIPLLSELIPDPALMALSLVFMLVSFVFTASVLAIFGATVTESQEGQQMVGLVVVPILLPVYAVSVFMNSPNGVLAR